MNLQRSYIVVSENGLYIDMFHALFNDLLVIPDSQFITTYWNDTGKYRNQIFRFLYKNKVNNLLNNSFERIIRPHYTLETALESVSNKKSCVIFNNASLKMFYNTDNLRKIKDKFPNTKFVLYFLDSVFQPTAKRAFELSKSGIFDLVYTYSKQDAERYSMIYYPTPYSKLNSPREASNKGVYFCGGDKGRVEELKKFARKCREENVTYKFTVLGDENKSNDYFHVNSTMTAQPYSRVLNDSLNYNCILDLVQESRKGVHPGYSLRVYEALVYNRVLVTNNPRITEFKYYNPNTMHYIKSADDFNRSWLNVVVENNYDNQFSPIHLAEDIECKLSKKGRN